MISECLRVIEKAVTLDNRDHGEPGHSSHRVAAKRAAVAARSQHPRGGSSRNAGPDGKPVAQALGDSNDVGPPTFVDMDQPAPAAAHAGLYLIHPQQGPLLIANLSRPREIPVWWHHNAVLSLDRFQYHRRDRLIDHRGQRLRVAVWHEDHLAGQRLERLAVLRIVSQGQSTHRTTM